MLNYLKIIHFHGKKVYLQVYGLQVIVIYPTSTCRNKFRWNIYYWELNLKIFFPKPSIFTTLCQITSCNLQQCCDIFLVDGMQRSMGPHPLEISLMFPTGSFSIFGHLDVFQVFHCGQDLGQPSAIFASWRWERWTRSFCSAMFPAAGTMLRACSCMSLQDRYVVPPNTFCKSTLSQFTVLKCWVPEGQHPKNTLVQWRRMMVTLGDIGERVGEPVVQLYWASPVTGGFHLHQEYIKAWQIHLSEVSHSWFICWDRWRAAWAYPSAKWHGKRHIKEVLPLIATARARLLQRCKLAASFKPAPKHWN